ncbi:hypothetical protein HYFRA_00009813 [Hymenoscyphus fraxineus]|uniref:Uncharacterized protein n=1 Tax=Hymenoscyphus fraxineus TaxID=746836 RepID=A0A9N9L2X1_9HELO|nr:hypothetical protein HYFRA_00009813 [Hymenoscyphus fraxineus]
MSDETVAKTKVSIRNELELAMGDLAALAYHAATADLAETLGILLVLEVESNIQGGLYRYPLQGAALHITSECVILLLKHGANFDAIIGDCVSALGAAAVARSCPVALIIEDSLIA